MIDEFKRLHDRFDAADTRFDTLEARLTHLATEVAEIRRKLNVLEEKVDNTSGFAKEIDHLLQRVAAIEKHLGLNKHIRT